MATASAQDASSLSDELQLFRKNVRRFAETELAPEVSKWEAEEAMPREIWNKLGEAGLLCVDIPERFGGVGAPLAFSAAVNEELNYAGCTALAGLVAVHSDIVAHYLMASATDEQKAKYLPKLASGEFVGAIAMTEPSAGSDLQGIRTTATRDGDKFVINGNKTFITNGDHSDIVLTVARTNPEEAASRGISIFIVETDSPGFSRGKRLEKIGLHSADTTELFYDNVSVGESQVLGDLDSGFAVLMNQLPRERWMLGIAAVAAAEAAFGWTV